MSSLQDEQKKDKETYYQVLNETHECLFCLVNNNICNFHRDILQELSDRLYDL